MRIRLIQPAQLDGNGNRIRYQKLFLPFLTLTTLAALTPEGVDVAITEDFVEDIDFDEDVDLVGITAQTSQADRAYQIADEFRKRGTRTIMGGIHCSMCQEEALEHVDAVLVGEAEDLWEGVLADVRKNDLRRIYRADRKPDLSRLVVPRFDLLNYDNYAKSPFDRKPLLPFQTSRGCPNYCDFCSVTSYLGHKVRTKPVANVVKEIERIEPSRILFTDDNIMGDRDHAAELFRALTPLRTRWACQMSTQVMNRPDLIELAAASGCHEAFIGIESVNQESLRSVSKGFNRPDKYAEFFRMLKDVGILAQASLVYGFDGDTADSLKRTIDTVLSWDVNYMYVFLLCPYPGTRLYDKMLSEGRILNDNWSRYDSVHPLISLAELTPDGLLQARWESYKEFYSLGNILRRAWRFRKQYVTFFPRDHAIEEIFFSLYTRRAICKEADPFSLGY